MKYLLILLLTTSYVSAKPKKATEYLKVSKVKGGSVLIGGKAADTVITSTVSIGMHVQANPASLPNLVATEVTLEPTEGFEVGPIEYPQGKPYRLANSDKDILTLDGTFDIKVPIKALSGKAKSGKVDLKGKLRYQACNDKICFFPTSAALTVPITVYK